MEISVHVHDLSVGLDIFIVADFTHIQEHF